MADERYQWLDQEAAERLLRGEPVDPVDDASRAQAELLARALDTARTPSAAATAGELPGEEAALAAFRKATAERAAAAGPAGTSAPADLGAVRIAPVPTGRRWGRSLRYGLAAALAAVTVGGVAVAAGTGMLPLTSEPASGHSVRAVDTTGPTASGSPGDGTGTGTGTNAPGVPADPDRTTGTPGPTGGPSSATPGAGDTAGATAEPDRTTAGPDGDGASRDKRIVEACKEYRAGRLTDSGRQRLAGSLRSGETVKRYCERVLAGAPSSGAAQPSAGRTTGGSGGSGGSGSGSGGGGPESGNADGDDKDDRGDGDRKGGGSGGARGSDGGAGDRGPVSGGPGAHGKDRPRS
ncbi:hypothetical protein [Streptomyces roseoviridis]|uniref:Extensin n=1 Tax=Streptomyces roseoviridis TaxID=67361 RepID=A0ABV5QJW1_9ACTN